VGWGRFYEVDDGARDLLAREKTKAGWYDALATLNIENSPRLDAEDSIRFWGTVLKDHPGPLSSLFIGEMHAIDEFDDPNVLFLGRDTVTEIAQAMNHLSQDYFAELFRSTNPDWGSHAWLYEPLRAFLASCQNRGKAVIIMWEN
jgi:hypothetical protein